MASSLNAADLKYNRDIRPILADNCFSCHGPDSAARKADLRLDQRPAAVDRKAIVPGNLAESAMIQRLLSTDPDEIMPPPASHKKLTPRQKQLLSDWVKSGAEYEPHWSYIAPTRATPPSVKDENWVRNPIDRFVLSRLESAGLSPAPEADRRTLARRLSLDLTGLPPAPELVEAFVTDSSPQAYEQLIDRLMQTPQWGEHRGRYWLDAARYADTHGIHFDNYREIWAYRNWVIDAFNRNVPFDQFTVEQLAGDLIPNATLDQKIASGFNRCNITTNEGGIIDEEYLVLYARDRTETTSAVWMGLTTGCAVCHDHKFDPLTQREFYELAAFFNNTTQPAKDGNIKDSPPIIVVPQTQDRDRWNKLDGEIAAAKQAVEQRRQAARTEFDQWLAGADATALTASLPTAGLQLQVPANDGPTKELKILRKGEAATVPLSESVEWRPGQTGDQALYLAKGGVAEVADVGDFDKDQPFSCAAWVKLPANDGTGAIVARMDDRNGSYRGWDLWVEGRRVGMHFIHKWQDDALKAVSKNQVKADEWTHVCVTYDGSMKAAGLKIYVNGDVQQTNVTADGLKNTTRTEVPLKLGQRHTGSPLTGTTVNDIRLYDRALSPSDVASLAKSTRYAALVAKPADQRTAKELDELYGWWLPTMDAEFQQKTAATSKLEREQSDIKARGTIAHVMNEKTDPAMAHILFRGEYDKRRDEVKADTPDILPQYPADVAKSRLGLAQWLLQPDHPLTARVTVNRYWQEVFGTGLVRTSGDFGVTGELPSHPELLDWLAVDFRENGWDTRRFFKQIVTSATYRQAAITTAEKLEADPPNRLMSRGPRFRMDAEMVRDYALAASGLLVPKIGGPSVKPYQPDGVWEAVAMIGSNTRNYKADSGEGLYRRSMYTFWKRSAPPASMDIFNATAREVCTVRRERTNTPLQALVTLNDPQHVEAARALAQRALKDGGENDAGRLDFIARRLLSRPFRDNERPIVTASLNDLRAYYQVHADDAGKLIAFGESKPDAALDASQLAAWTMLTNELMNLDEVLNK
ncbi:MAG TPA: DUF1553 domain-containing protein [Planctomycetaceae bacterium]|nr:DUF1553 domain-containing protein [Planctomycetaceae bacterium]